MSDYRRTPLCPKRGDVKQKKELLEIEIRSSGRITTQNMYAYVSDRNGEFNHKFIEAYDSRCSYCGCSVDILPRTLFEIDHYFPESKFNNKPEAGKMSNIVLACRKCNGAKSNSTDDTYDEKMHPYRDEILEIFCRDEMFKIAITETHKDNVSVRSFYDALKLYEQTRRLDYLLVYLHAYINILDKSTERYTVLLGAFEMLRQKRNYVL